MADEEIRKDEEPGADEESDVEGHKHKADKSERRLVDDDSDDVEGHKHKLDIKEKHKA